MRTFLGFLLALLVVGLTSVDPLVCPDGCADEPIGHAPSAPASVGQCGFCVGARVATAVPTFAPVVRVESPSIPPFLIIASPDLPGIEHPPRLA